MRLDIMVDIETLGTKADSTIIQIAAIAFDIKNGMVHAKFNRIADVSKNEDYEMNVSGSTLKWWVDTNKDLFVKLLTEGEGSSTDILNDFHSWLVALGTIGELYLWGNGIMFDNKMIQTQFDVIGMEYPIHYRNDRDLRTLVDLACAKLGLTQKELRDKCYYSELEAHDAYNDVLNQISMTVFCYNELIGTSDE